MKDTKYLELKQIDALEREERDKACSVNLIRKTNSEEEDD